MADPRAYSEILAGWRRRAHLAHLNAFEAVPAFIAGVVVAELAQAPRLHVDALALLFVGLRVAHAALYLADRPSLRSAAWKLGILCVIALFVETAILACDFFVAVTATFRLLYVFVVIEHGTRRLAHLNVTAHPSPAWTLQQL